MLATIPIGYADGVRRALTNNADVLIGGDRYPLVGTVSMDNITVDLGPATIVEVGDRATLIGVDNEEEITAEEVARRLDTINYEVTCGISRAGAAGVRRAMSDDALTITREALAGTPRLARRRSRPRPPAPGSDLAFAHLDLDLVIDGDVRAAAKQLGARGGRPVVRALRRIRRLAGHRRRSRWQADLTPLRGGSLEADLSLRDFTVNAIAEPLAGGELVDPFGGARDLDGAAACASVGPQSFADDPLRVLRLARFAVMLGLTPEEGTVAAARDAAAELAQVAAGARLRRAQAHRRRRRGGRRGCCSPSAPARCTPSCPSSASCAASSRPSTTTATRTATRSRCSSAPSRSTATRWRVARRGPRRARAAPCSTSR